MREARISLVTVGVFLTAHAAIVLHVAPGEVFSDVLVLLDVLCSQIAMFVAVDLIEIPMRGRFALRIALAVVSRRGSRACEEQYGAGQ